MRTSTIFTVAGVTLVTGAVAYAIWFDSKRRSDADFRKKLRKEKKKVEKVAAQQQEQAATAAGGSTTVTQADLRAALEKIKSEPIPGSPEQKEAYFMEQVNNGESLCTQGPAFALPAAMCFFRALRVYPQPMELLQIYQGTVPEPVFKLMIEMTQLDVKTRIESYWDNFPPADMNVTVKPVDIADASGTINRKRVLVVNKDVSAGDVIYKETPVIGALDADLEGKGEYCSYCFKSTDPATAIRPSSDKLSSTYCSKEHELAATLEYQALLFGVESPVPADVDPTNTPESAAKRGEAQDKLVSMLKESGKIQPLLLARFLARVVSGELSKLFPGLVASAPAHIFGLTDFSLYDHMERLRYLELTVADDEMKALREVFQYTMAGLEQALDDEPYKTLKGKMAYNAYGVYHGEGRSDKPEPAGRPEDRERTRTSIGTSKQIGSAFYFLSSYIQHDCDPSAKITFPDGTGDLTLVAARDVKAGDELTVAFVDVSQHEGESVAEGRRRRRYELTRGWRFACPCKRCVAENEGGTDEPAVVHDESKVEKPIERHEAQEAETFAATVD